MRGKVSAQQSEAHSQAQCRLDTTSHNCDVSDTKKHRPDTCIFSCRSFSGASVVRYTHKLKTPVK